MYLGEQLINPTEARLRLSAQLGAKAIVVDTRPNLQLLDEDGRWNAQKVAAQRRFVESFGLRLEVMALDLGSILLDFLYAPERAAVVAEGVRRDIRAAAAGGVATLKYNAQMVGITRTGTVEGAAACGARPSGRRITIRRGTLSSPTGAWGTPTATVRTATPRPMRSARRRPAGRCWQTPSPA
ncbi:hypothetical protein ACE7GA_14165 [Roseomonas sp. CCTCC AB2023176]|uniref:hypothetical protein n=1 Tax=Roseomonas sp. CCTCC AB2023176 TaxID=3342640 RepID=UPI0035DAB357